MTVHGFWGLQVLPGKQYTQNVTLPFMITMASLTDAITSNKRCSLLIKVDGEEYIMCSLTPEKLEQQVLSTTIMQGEEVTFSIRGDNAMHLTGNHVFDIKEYEIEDQQPEHALEQYNHTTTSRNSDDDGILTTDINNQQKRKRPAESDRHDTAKKSKGNHILSNHRLLSTCKKEQRKLQSYMDSLNGHVQQLEQQLSSLSDRPQQNIDRDSLESSTEDKDSTAVQPAMEKSNEDSKDKKARVDKKKAEDDRKKLDGKKNQSKKQEVISNKKPLSISASTSTSEASTTTKRKSTLEGNPKKLKVVRLPNGMVVEDKKIGTGRPAGPGCKVGLRYLGKLVNGRKFDSNTAGTPFRFTLGKGSVIRGWDIGIAGMKVGGERKLVIPPSLAYRQRGVPPDIPPNSTLVFDVKLVELK
ncbi:hypothetical protein BCR42DRAFT_406966 [Absidia repens]|uniref:FK506-binding protein n=1 Tax=Absidia repens TaxID=90262 RepID=A0A1X2IRJ5_9FUNG|nr:hypothetical protein BCR42DRAFT_406966 [Absidia repens]